MIEKRPQQTRYKPAAAFTVTFTLIAVVAGLYPRASSGRPQAPRSDPTVFTVTLGIDAVDLQPGDGRCETAQDGGPCSIRAAVQEANARPESGPYVVALPPGDYQLSIPGDSEDDAVSGDVDIRTTLDLVGAGQDVVTIHGPNEELDHAFEVIPPAVVRVRGVTIRDSAGGGIENRLGQLEVADSTIRDNHAHFGGGIASDGVFTLTHSVISHNVGGQGGGLVIFGSSRAVIRNSRIEGNGDAQGGGMKVMGALEMSDSVVADNLGGHGAGIQLLGDAPIVIRDTVVMRNHASPHPEPPWHGYGGGVWNNATNVRLENVTITDNWGQGGGIYNLGEITVASSTLASNGTDSWGAAINNLGLFRMVNTIVGPSARGGNCDVSRAGLTSGGHNIDRDGSCMLTEPSDRQAIDPLLGPLADNGGSTLTHALLTESPAIDAGDDDKCPLADQRGAPRPAGAACDIGAFEYGATPGAPTRVVTPTPETTSTTPTPTATPDGPTPTATTTPTIPPDIRLTGSVTDAVTGAPVAGATVAIEVCVPRQPFQGTTGPDGRYSVLFPGPYTDLCPAVTLEVRATGYTTRRQAEEVANLRANPRRDFALVPAGGATPTATATVTATPTTTATATPTGAVYLPRLLQVLPR
jgi:hypothetical protein